MNPLSFIYGRIVWARNELYDRELLRSQRLQGAVVSVGNLSSGGSGKTPFVLLLGGLLILLGASGHAYISARPSTLLGIGILLAYLGVRAWTKPEKDASRLQINLRAISLLLVGALMFATPYVSPQYSRMPLILAGTILAIRGAWKRASERLPTPRVCRSSST